MNHEARAQTFSALHEQGFLLPNAWDASSARLFEEAGFPAIGTTSAGIAYSRGLRDGELLSRDEMLHEVANIVARVDLPVNADIEAGYGDDPSAVGQTVSAFLATGVVGLNLEDARPGASALYTRDEQRARLEAARSAADTSGHHVYLNARTDTYLSGFGRDEDERFDETVRRGRAYLEAGANSVFVPLLVDLDTIARLKAQIDGPVTVMAFPGAPRVADLLAAGASRVSIGQGAMVAALGLVARIAQELRDTGSYTQMAQTFYGFREADALFAGAQPR
jgi:2-methylisocitrate lyase-like PEP mutase family enzyme